MKLVIEYPKENEKGVLKYIRNSALFNEILQNPSEFKVKDIDNAYDWLLSLVIEPEDRDEAYDLLMELTAEELAELFGQLSVSLETDPKLPENSEDG